MHIRKNLSTPIFFPIAVLIMAVVASCGVKPVNTTAQTPPVSTQAQVKNGPTKTPKKTKTPLTTKIPLATKTTVPDSIATAVPLGLSRKNPYPLSKAVSAPNWDIQVLEVKRGEAAWQDIQAADPFNEAAPEGMEYLIVKLHVKSTYTDDAEHSLSSCDFGVTGNRLINYTCGTAGQLEPSLDVSLAAGGEAEGWVTYLVAQGEKNLELVFQELFSLDENAIRYIALDQGASISIPNDLLNIKPDDMGLTRDNPAPRTESVTTREWVLSVNDVVRGEDAWTMVQEANQFNDPPAAGMEYLAVKIHVRYIGTVDKAVNIDGSSFSSTGSENKLYDYPSVSEPVPPLNIALFPGGEYEGWLVLQAAQGETGVMLVFTWLLDNGDQEQRFISLEP